MHARKAETHVRWIECINLARYAHVHAHQRFVEVDGVNVNKKDEDERTPLHWYEHRLAAATLTQLLLCVRVRVWLTLIRARTIGQLPRDTLAWVRSCSRPCVCVWCRESAGDG
jgi:hypothetical protein